MQMMTFIVSSVAEYFGNYFEHLSLGGSSLHSVRDHGDFSTQMLPKVMQRRVLKRYSGLHCVIFFVILILQLTADSAVKEL